MNEKMQFLCELVLGSFPWLMFWCIAINETSLFLLFAGDHLFRDLGVDLSICGFCSGGSVGGDQFSLSASETSAPHGQPGQKYILSHQQHDKPGHLCSVSHQHSGLDDPLAGAESWPHPPDQLHHRQRGSGHHDRHEHCVVLPPDEKWLHEVQPWTGGEEREGERNVGRGLFPLQLQLQPNPLSSPSFPDFGEKVPFNLLTSFL